MPNPIFIGAVCALADDAMDASTPPASDKVCRRVRLVMISLLKILLPGFLPCFLAMYHKWRSIISSFKRQAATTPDRHRLMQALRN
jgi:hypothetical protein